MISLKCTFLKTQSSRLPFSLARHKNAFGQNRKEEAKLKAVAQISYENQESETASGPLLCMIFISRNMDSSYLLQRLFTTAAAFP